MPHILVAAALVSAIVVALAGMSGTPKYRTGGAYGDASSMAAGKVRP